MDWDDLRMFLAITRNGTLSAAARALGATQPTVGRRLASLESALGARLFERTPNGLHLTAAGESALRYAEQMEASALSLGRSVAGFDERLEGTVKLVSLETFGARFLTPFMRDFRKAHPAISIELATVDRAVSLSQREADVAVMLTRFHQHAIVMSRIGTLGYALYATPEYIETRGMPDYESGCAGHELVSPDVGFAWLPEARWLESVGRAATIAFRSNSREAQLAAAAAGMGLALLPCYLGDSIPALTRLPTAPVGFTRDVWLGVHRDARGIPRIRAFIDFVTEVFRQERRRLTGGEGSDA